MAHYVVGDVQGCFSELQALLQQVDFQPSRDRLSFLGPDCTRSGFFGSHALGARPQRLL